MTRPLKDGRVRPDRLKLEFVPVSEIVPVMRRMVRGLEFDVCELAFTTYLCARAYGKPITAIPVFLTRNFHHWAAFRHVRSGIGAPKDLEGRAVAVNRGYTVTTGLWARGILQSEYGVDLDRIRWLPTDDEHVAEFRAPSNVDYRCRGKSIAELLRSRVADAAVGDVRVDSPEIQPLLTNAREAGFAFFRKTGVYPINHGLVVKNEILRDAPWIAAELFRLFSAAKAIYLAELGKGARSVGDDLALQLQAIVGDPFPFGIEANRRALQTIVRYAVDQHILPTEVDVPALFAAETFALD